jgi:hypothetical protein
MIGVAGGAACLLDLFFDHGEDDMVGHAALARTVVVENVTEPNPALLHELPREPFLQGGIRGTVARLFRISTGPLRCRSPRIALEADMSSTPAARTVHKFGSVSEV